MVSDKQVDRLVRVLDQIDDVEQIAAPYSRSAETPPGHLPLFKPNEDEDGWVT
jgi:hypothetical protein